MIHLARMGWSEKGKNRIPDKEPVPNIHHWRQEFLLKTEGPSSNLYVVNQTSEKDAERKTKIAKEDFLFSVGPDRVLHLGTKKNNLHLTVLHPKTEKRSTGDDISLDKIIKERVPDVQMQSRIEKLFLGKNSKNLKKVQLKCEVFDLKTKSLIGRGTSSVIRDKGYWTLEMKEVRPRVSCCRGGRDILLVTRHSVKKGTVEPVFQLFDSQGQRMKDEEHWLKQPEVKEEDERHLRFVAPRQDNHHHWAHLTLRLKLRRRDEAELYSSSSCNFSYRQHDSCQYWLVDQPSGQSSLVCLFCHPEILDGGNSGLPGADVPSNSGPGLKRRPGPQVLVNTQTEVRQLAEVNHNHNLVVMEDPGHVQDIVVLPHTETEHLVNPAKRPRMIMEEMESEMSSSEVIVEGATALANVDTQWQDITEVSSSLNTPEGEPFSLSPESLQDNLESLISTYDIPPVSESPPEDIFSEDTELNLVAEAPPRKPVYSNYSIPEDIIPDGSSPRSRSVAPEKKTVVGERSVAGPGLRGWTVQAVFGDDQEALRVFGGRREPRDLRVIFNIVKRHYEIPLILLITIMVFFILPVSEENMLAVLAVAVLLILFIIYHNIKLKIKRE